MSKLEYKIIKAIGKACAKIEAEAKKKCPVDTGLLRNSISYKVEKDGNQIIGTVKATAPYAAYVEYGTGLFADGGRTTA